MAKQTPRQKRQATAKRLERMLPEKGKATETVVPPDVMRRAIRDLKR